MSVAVIQGGGGAIGSTFARQLLRSSALHIVSTARDPDSAKRRILSDVSNSEELSKRLTVLEVDTLREDSIETAAKEVKDRWGDGCLRLLINASGVLHADKSITKISAEDLLHSYQINTFGHILTYKHFVPLLPSKAAKQTPSDDGDATLQPGLSVLASLTARMGSIGDNRKGGWLGYRSAKAATNQAIMCLQRELTMKDSPAIAVALHPGTVVGTHLSKPWTKEDDAGNKPGVFRAEQSVEHLLKVVKELKAEDGGRFIDWAGKDIVW
ncbi:short-chain dehydrogenase/reductase SDR family protein [Pseudohyphozyma bogoriensis]|nr:short-chain dehydrogenase/reductase SDR family protein [Pseudohyphozyma bogoriensis]